MLCLFGAHLMELKLEQLSRLVDLSAYFTLVDFTVGE